MMFSTEPEPHRAAVPARLSSPMDALGYVGHGKGPWLAMGHDFGENSVLPPPVPLPLAVFFAAPMPATSRSIPATSISAIPTPPTSRKPDNPFIIDSDLGACVHTKLIGIGWETQLKEQAGWVVGAADLQPCDCLCRHDQTHPHLGWVFKLMLQWLTYLGMATSVLASATSRMRRRQQGMPIRSRLNITGCSLSTVPATSSIILQL